MLQLKLLMSHFFFHTLGAKNGSRNVTFILSQIDLIRSTYLKKKYRQNKLVKNQRIKFEIK